MQTERSNKKPGFLPKPGFLLAAIEPLFRELQNFNCVSGEGLENYCRVPILQMSLLDEEVRFIGNGSIMMMSPQIPYCSYENTVEDNTMRDVDFSPLYRSAIGFDRMASMLDNLTRTEQSQPSYPPYNIELIGENEYRISMAVAGFTEAELTIESGHNTLSVNGKKGSEETERQFLHRGIGARNFVRHFQLADHVRVVNASLENGLLHIDLVREIPEAMKPRTIKINGANLVSVNTTEAA